MVFLTQEFVGREDTQPGGSWDLPPRDRANQLLPSLWRFF